MEAVEAFVVLRCLPSRRSVHAEHLPGAPEDDRAPSGVRQIRILANPKQAFPMGRWHQILVPRESKVTQSPLWKLIFYVFSEPARQRLAGRLRG